MAIDHTALSQHLLSQAKITEARHAQYLGDHEALTDDLCLQGETVLSLRWDGNAPGYSGEVRLSKWNDLFFLLSSDFEPEGPFESLDQALRLECFQVPVPNPELASPVLPLPALLEIGSRLVAEEAGGISINGVRHTLQAGHLVECGKPE